MTPQVIVDLASWISPLIVVAALACGVRLVQDVLAVRRQEKTDGIAR